jgi:hypothetical protein
LSFWSHADKSKAAADIIIVLKQPLIDILERMQTKVLMVQENCDPAHSEYNNFEAAYQTFQDGKSGLGDKRSNHESKLRENFFISETQKGKNL